MTGKPTTKTPPAQVETPQPEPPVRVRPKLSLHYGASSGGDRK